MFGWGTENILCMTPPWLSEPALTIRLTGLKCGLLSAGRWYRRDLSRDAAEEPARLLARLGALFYDLLGGCPA
jgi:hypothetical protein